MHVIIIVSIQITHGSVPPCKFSLFLVNNCNFVLFTAKEMNNITNRFRLGFGGFVDKPVAPYIDTAPAA